MLDVRGRSCPEPVIMVKKALESKEKSYEVLADNIVAVENVSRFAESMGYNVSVSDCDGDYELILDKK